MTVLVLLLAWLRKTTVIFIATPKTTPSKCLLATTMVVCLTTITPEADTWGLTKGGHPEKVPGRCDLFNRPKDEREVFLLTKLASGYD